MLFQRPYISKSSGSACPRTPSHLVPSALVIAPPSPPANKSNLATALHDDDNDNVKNSWFYKQNDAF